MSSFVNRVARRIAQKSLTKAERKELRNKPQVMRFNDDGGYDVYHPTRGWKHVSGKRIAAQGRVAQLKGLLA